MTIARQVHLVRRPKGVPVPEDFAVVEAQLPDAGEGEIQVEGLILSVDPYMRPRLDADQKLGEAMAGGGIGRVVQSRNAKFREGDIVRHGQGFSERFNSDGRGVSVLTPDPDLPLSVYMHALGGTGITAYGGLLETGALKDGEQVFVSTAAGAVGSVVAQIAKIKGCYVIGSTGSDEKKRWLLDEAGLDVLLRNGFAGVELCEDLVEGVHELLLGEHGHILPIAGVLLASLGASVLAAFPVALASLATAGLRAAAGDPPG